MRDEPTSFASAIAQGNREVFLRLLAPHTDADAIREFSGMTLLHFAVGQGHLWAVEALLAKGADPNRLTPNGKTALDLALDPSSPRPKIAEHLRSIGAKIKAELPQTIAAQNRAALKMKPAPKFKDMP